MITLILFISICNALAWAVAVALLANSGWESVTFLLPEHVLWAFVVALVATFGLLYFITSAWRGKVDG